MQQGSSRGLSNACFLPTECTIQLSGNKTYQQQGRQTRPSSLSTPPSKNQTSPRQPRNGGADWNALLLPIRSAQLSPAWGPHLDPKQGATAANAASVEPDSTHSETEALAALAAFLGLPRLCVPGEEQRPSPNPCPTVEYSEVQSERATQAHPRSTHQEGRISHPLTWQIRPASWAERRYDIVAPTHRAGSSGVRPGPHLLISRRGLRD